MTDTRKLSDAFAAVLRKWLSADEMAEIRRRNATPEYAQPICATHDFCDANVAMLEAFESVFGRECDFTDADMEAMGAAWNLARKEHLMQPLPVA